MKFEIKIVCKKLSLTFFMGCTKSKLKPPPSAIYSYRNVPNLDFYRKKSMTNRESQLVEYLQSNSVSSSNWDHLIDSFPNVYVQYRLKQELNEMNKCDINIKDDTEIRKTPIVSNSRTPLLHKIDCDIFKTVFTGKTQGDCIYYTTLIPGTDIPIFVKKN